MHRLFAPEYICFIECPSEFCRLQRQTLLHPLTPLHLALTRIPQAMLVQLKIRTCRSWPGRPHKQHHNAYHCLQ